MGSKKLSNETPLTMKQKKFVKNVVTTQNFSKSGLAAGYQDPAYGSYLMQQPKIMNALQKALDDAGLTDTLIAKKLREGLDAYYVKKDGGKKYPDFHAREKSIVDVVKIKGGFAPEKHEIRQEKLVLIVTPEVIKGLEDAKALNKENRDIIEATVVEEETDDTHNA